MPGGSAGGPAGRPRVLGVGLAAAEHLGARREADAELEHADLRPARGDEVAELVDQHERAEDEDEQEDRDRGLRDARSCGRAPDGAAREGGADLGVERDERVDVGRLVAARRRSARPRPRAGAGCPGSRACRRGTGRPPPRRRRSGPRTRGSRSGRRRARCAAPGSAPRRARGSPAAPPRSGRAGPPVTGGGPGCVRAYWMGSRMSGVPSWAFSEPSMNWTAECTTLCGWTTTSIAS